MTVIPAPVQGCRYAGIEVKGTHPPTPQSPLWSSSDVYNLHFFNSEIRFPQNFGRKREIIDPTKVLWIPGNVLVVPPLQT